MVYFRIKSFHLDRKGEVKIVERRRKRGAGAEERPRRIDVSVAEGFKGPAKWGLQRGSFERDLSFLVFELGKGK